MIIITRTHVWSAHKSNGNNQGWEKQNKRLLLETKALHTTTKKNISKPINQHIHIYIYMYIYFFLSWLANTQLNLWTQQVVSIQLIMWDPRNCPEPLPKWFYSMCQIQFWREAWKDCELRDHETPYFGAVLTRLNVRKNRQSFVLGLSAFGEENLAHPDCALSPTEKERLGRPHGLLNQTDWTTDCLQFKSPLHVSKNPFDPHFCDKKHMS